jgi:endonuclease/exonuclease/phosphatase (EEP) superfamily protein YafD
MSDEGLPAAQEVGRMPGAGSRKTQAEPGWRRLLARFAIVGLIAVLLATIAGFGSRTWWLFELTSHFRIQYFWTSLLLSGLLLVARRWRFAILALLLLALHGWLLRPFYVDRAHVSNDGPVVRVMTYNIWARNREYDEIISYLRKSSPDIVVLVEVDERWRAPLETLAPEWPHRRMILKGGHSGIAILSRLPLDELKIEFLSDGIPFVFARATINGTPVSIFGIHLERPISARGTEHQSRQMAELTARLRQEPPTRLVLGDFNSTTWSAAFCEFALETGLRDSRIGFGIQPTWPAFLPAAFRIPIDHCLVTPDVEITRREIGPNVGSDHFPVVVDLKIPFRASPAP